MCPGTIVSRSKGIIFSFVLFVAIGVGQERSLAHGVLTDQVIVLSAQGQLFGVTANEGIARHTLRAGEKVVAMESKGITGFVLTTTRLMGFSGARQRWVPFRISTAEKILSWTVTSRMIIVQGEQATYGFQSKLGRWKRESLGAGESLKHTAVNDAVAVVVTDRRALGFSAMTGGFFSKDLPVDDEVETIQRNDRVIILHLSDRIFVFRAGLAIWAELP